MSDSVSIYIGKGEEQQYLDLKLANRHGLIAGATGTGKTVSLQILAEGFSRQGVPVFMADVKGDLSGISQSGKTHKKLEERAETIGLEDYNYREFPTVFWDLFGKQGHPIRTTISEMGPLLLSRLLELNDTQEGVVNIVFKLADDEGMLLLDLKDFRAMLNFVGETSAQLTTEYGNVSKASVGAIQRRLLVLEQQGGEHFFGEPALELDHFMQTNDEGFGYINVLAADKLMQHPRMYATFLLWLLSELFEELPEVGDPDKPKLVFFFDEAHLLFNRAPRALIEKVEQVVRLIRSKGVGIYFVTQNPMDIPDSVLSQLGNRIQHALRAYTPREQKAVRVAAETFRANPNFDAAQAITELGVGEALVSTLQKKGVPSIVDRTLIRPPSSRLGPANKTERKQVLENSHLSGVYEDIVDRISASEMLKKRAEKAAEEEASESRRLEIEKPKPRSRGRQRQGVLETMAKSVARTLGTKLGRQIVRGVLGSIFKGR
ncbi:MAG: helicase HerA-like domain-containing protein [Gammaproteobacteria bacterium]